MSERKRLYIRHEDLQTPGNGEAYFGPFEDWEIYDRLHGSFADLLAQTGDVDSVELTDSEAAKIVTNTKDYWLRQEDETVGD